MVSLIKICFFIVGGALCIQDFLKQEVDERLFDIFVFTLIVIQKNIVFNLYWILSVLIYLMLDKFGDKRIGWVDRFYVAILILLFGWKGLIIILLASFVGILFGIITKNKRVPFLGLLVFFTLILYIYPYI